MLGWERKAGAPFMSGVEGGSGRTQPPGTHGAKGSLSVLCRSRRRAAPRGALVGQQSAGHLPGWGALCWLGQPTGNLREAPPAPCGFLLLLKVLHSRNLAPSW